MRELAAVLVALLLLSSCEQHEENARQILTTFCSLHKADIFATLLTQDQRDAATKVCAAIGLRLGSD